MKTRVKLCGLQHTEEVLTAHALRADYIGFVMAKSQRQVTLQAVIQMLQETQDKLDEPIYPQAVLVLVDEPLTKILALTAQTGVRHVQLCGDETPEFCRELREEHGLRVWKAWGVHGTDEDRGIAKYAGKVDAILFDTYRKERRGGTGQTFPWTQIPQLRQWLGSTPWVVAGGLTCATVGSLVREYRPFAVDVSSGIETAREKDAAKMRLFVDNVRSETDVS